MRKTVLVVEDDPDNLETLSELLTEEGYDVVTARSGREARERLRRPRLCLVLADYMLPDATGDEVVRLVREHEQHRKVPVVILTAANQPPMHGLTVPILKKPISLEELLDTVRQQCGAADEATHTPATNAELDVPST